MQRTAVGGLDDSPSELLNTDKPALRVIKRTPDTAINRTYEREAACDEALAPR